MQSSEVKFNSVALFAIQHAELWSEALRQCWATRQWDIVPRPSWSYGDVTPRILQDQHPAIPLQILVNPFITSWNPRRNIFKTCLHEMVNKCSLHVHVQSRSRNQSKPLKTGAGGPADKIAAPPVRISEACHCPPPETIVTGVSGFEWGGFNLPSSLGSNPPVYGLPLSPNSPLQITSVTRVNPELPLCSRLRHWHLLIIPCSITHFHRYP